MHIYVFAKVLRWGCERKVLFREIFIASGTGSERSSGSGVDRMHQCFNPTVNSL